MASPKKENVSVVYCFASDRSARVVSSAVLHWLYIQVLRRTLTLFYVRQNRGEVKRVSRAFAMIALSPQIFGLAQRGEESSI